MSSTCRRIGTIDRRRGPSSLGLTEGVKGNVVEVRIVHGGLPNFRSRSSGETLRVAITHYKAIAVVQVAMSKGRMRSKNKKCMLISYLLQVQNDPNRQKNDRAHRTRSSRPRGERGG